MYKLLLRWMLLICSLCFFSLAASASCKPHNPNLHVLAVVSATEQDSFWSMYSTALSEAAKDLNVYVEFLYLNNHQDNRFIFTDTLKRRLEQAKKPDAVLTTLFLNAEESALDLLASHNIYHIIVNTSLQANLIDKIKQPRERNQYWLALMTPNDKLASYQLMQELLIRHKNKSTTKPIVVALAGAHASTVSENRVSGLNQVLTEQNLAIPSPMYTDWNYASAHQSISALYRRVPDINIIWTVSSTLARAASDHIAERQITHPISIGTFDWTIEALDLIRQGKADVSIGGHFLEGAWSLLLLYDFLHGQDFIDDLEPIIQTELTFTDKSNVEKFTKYITHTNLANLNFALMSKCLNPKLQNYDFNIETLIELTEAL
ncbi:ABC transporter substrate-binding protein [Catenovulum agarivorans]|uniref:ABC transporter substrate-binding protein n=1 Tax=Catenovulum agarivorans TaxID=1172192 RepID=UPI00035C251C|nr:ABC transporter substrate-binding protein [Catenovulum agarivorans]